MLLEVILLLRHGQDLLGVQVILLRMLLLLLRILVSILVVLDILGMELLRVYQ